jgi:hypothetical protein
MHRGLALAFDYAKKRVAFGAPLSEKPLHMDTLLGLQVETEAAFHLAFFVAELNGKSEAGEISEKDVQLLRVLTPIMKLTTAKQAVMVASEVLESFGGAGYIEDTGLPVLLRDTQVLPIWEGTTNVLALDTFRALGIRTTSEAKGENKLEVLLSQFKRWFESIRNPLLINAGQTAMSALEHASRWLLESNNLEGGARRFAITLGRAVELALLVRHAQWSEDHEANGTATAAAHRFAHSGIDMIID